MFTLDRIFKKGCSQYNGLEKKEAIASVLTDDDAVGLGIEEERNLLLELEVYFL